jgi:hypothetical protein
MKLRTALPLLSLLLAACSGGLRPELPPGGATAALRAEGRAGAYRVAPYVDLTSWPQPQLARYAEASGNAYYTLAFLQSYEPGFPI